MSDREMDVRIAREVMGWTGGEGNLDTGDAGELYEDRSFEMGKCNFVQCGDIPFFTQDDAAALQALDKLCQGGRIGYWEVSGGKGPTNPRCTVEWLEVGQIVSEKKTEYADSRPLAICRAIIAFLDWRKEQGNG